MNTKTLLVGLAFLAFGGIFLWMFTEIAGAYQYNGINNLFNPLFFISVLLLIFGTTLTANSITLSTHLVGQSSAHNAPNSGEKRSPSFFLKNNLRKVGILTVIVGILLTYFGTTYYTCGPISPVTHLRSYCETYYFQPFGWSPFIPDISQASANDTFSYIGIVILVIGSILVARSFEGPRYTIEQSTIKSEMKSLGWLVLASGLIASTIAFIEGNSIMCGCPASGPCDCGEFYVYLMIFGLAATLLGLASLLAASKVMSKSSVQVEESQRPA